MITNKIIPLPCIDLLALDEIQKIFSSVYHQQNMFGTHHSFSPRFKKLTSKFHNEGWAWSDGILFFRRVIAVLFL